MPEIVQSTKHSPGGEAVAEASEVLRSGGLVVFPTETVYGLGADATSDIAVAKIFEAKGRPQFNPLIVHVGSLEAAQTLGVISGKALELATAFWPGPLTLVVPRQHDCKASLLVSAGLDTIALRVPGNQVAQDLLAQSGLPIAAPSANISGNVSPTQAEHVVAELGDKIDYLVDAGPCSVGLESTIIGFAAQGALLLRPGGLIREDIEACIGAVLVISDDDKAPSSPGQLESHYAPRAKLRLNADQLKTGELMLGFGDIPDENLPAGSLNLSPTGDLREAAANLFDFLRKLDSRCPASIAVAPIPNSGLGEAINDRLARASAPRDPGESA